MRERHARGEARGDPSRVIVRLYQIGALARRVYRSHTKPGDKRKAGVRGVTDTRDGKMLPPCVSRDYSAHEARER